MTSWVYKLTLDEARYINKLLGGQIDESKTIYTKNGKVKLSDRYRKYLARLLEKVPKDINEKLKIEVEATHLAGLKIEKLDCDEEIRDRILQITLDELEIDENYTETQKNRLSGIFSNILGRYKTDGEEQEVLDKTFIEIDETEIMNELVKEMSAKAGNVEPRNFEGKEEENVNEFIKNVEMCGVLNGWDDEIKLKQAAKALKGKAFEWLIDVIEEKNTDLNWGVLKAELKNKYEKTRSALMSELIHAKQGKDETMSDFLTRIIKLGKIVDEKMNEADLCKFVVDGLKKEYRDRISILSNKNIEELRENLKREEHNKVIREKDAEAENQVKQIEILKEKMDKILEVSLKENLKKKEDEKAEEKLETNKKIEEINEKINKLMTKNEKDDESNINKMQGMENPWDHYNFRGSWASRSYGRPNMYFAHFRGSRRPYYGDYNDRPYYYDNYYRGGGWQRPHYRGWRNGYGRWRGSNRRGRRDEGQSQSDQKN